MKLTPEARLRRRVLRWMERLRRTPRHLIERHFGHWHGAAHRYDCPPTCRMGRLTAEFERLKRLLADPSESPDFTAKTPRRQEERRAK